MVAPDIHLEAPYLPRPDVVRPGFTVFRTDTGTLWQFGTAWEEIPVPEGKVWFTPALELKTMQSGVWVALGDI